jgi:hypothetical protein
MIRKRGGRRSTSEGIKALCHLHFCDGQKIYALQNQVFPDVGPKNFCKEYISVLWLFLVLLHTTLIWLCSGVLTNCCHYLAPFWCSRQHS